LSTKVITSALVSVSIDRYQRAVEDRVCQPADPMHGSGPIVGGRREQSDRFLHVPPGGADAHLEPGGQPV
jgi:hypothetical protein